MTRNLRRVRDQRKLSQPLVHAPRPSWILIQRYAPLKGCVLWNLRAFMVRTMVSVRGRAKLCRKSLDFRYVPERRITRKFLNPRSASKMKPVSDRDTGGNNFGRARCVLSRRRNHCCDTFSTGEVLSNSGDNKGFLSRHTWVRTSCQARNHATPNDLTFAPHTLVRRTCPDLQLPRQVARVFRTRFGVGEGEKGGRPPSDS